MKIFIADDDPIYNRMAMSHLIQNNAYIGEVKCFETGEELLKSLIEKPDIIFLDYYFLGYEKYSRNGLSLLKSIRFRLPDTNCYMVTGCKDEEIKKKLTTEGAVTVLEKNNEIFVELNNVINQESTWRSHSNKLYNHQRIFFPLLEKIGKSCQSVILYFRKKKHSL